MSVKTNACFENRDRKFVAPVKNAAIVAFTLLWISREKAQCFYYIKRAEHGQRLVPIFQI